MRKIPIPTVLTAGALVLVLLTYALTFQVRFSEVAVKVRLGKADESSVITDPGIKLRWPWPVESIVKYDTRLQTLDIPDAEIKTRDGKNVIVGAYALWRVEDPLEFFKRVATMREAESQLRARLGQIRQAEVGRHNMSFFVDLDEQQIDQNYDEFAAAMLQEAAPGIRADYGVALEAVRIRRISLPEEVTRKVFEQMIQEREKVAAGYREEGKSKAEAIRARAEAYAKQIMALANRKAQEIRSTGIQAATATLEKIAEQDREFFNWLRWLDALSIALKERSTIFLDSGSPLFEPFVKPAIPVVPGPESDASASAAPQPQTRDAR